MKQLAVAVTSLSLAASVLAQAEQALRVTPNGSQPSGKAVEWMEKVSDAQYGSTR
jgi:hypothetical protein